MTVVNVYDAKTRLSKLIEEAAAGNDVIIARGGKPVARLTQMNSDPFDRLLLAQSFSEPLRFVTSDALLAVHGGAIEVL